MVGVEEAVAGAAPPDAAARRTLAAVFHEAGREDLARRELDRLAALDEADLPPLAPAAATAPADGAPREQAIRAGDWLQAPGGKPLEPLRAFVLRLRPGRGAFARLDAPGRMAIDAAVAPGGPDSPVCVLLDGRHLGHFLAGAAWAEATFDVPAAGWLEIAPALERHRIPTERGSGILVRACSVRR
jgi:hypothetical protein